MKSFFLVYVFLASALFSAMAEKAETDFPEKLNVITRKDWDAKPPVSEMKAHKPTFITIHHTGTKQNPNRTIEDKLRGLQKYSQTENQLAGGKTKPAWPDVPYHFYISVDGKVAEGREINFAGDTNTEYDPTGHILVTLEGNFEEEQPTEEQMMVMREVVRFLANKYKVPSGKIGTHKDYAKTACPGENLQKQMPGLREAVR